MEHHQAGNRNKPNRLGSVWCHVIGRCDAVKMSDQDAFWRRCPATPVGKWSVTDAFFRNLGAKPSDSGKGRRAKARRKRPGVGWAARSQKPVGTGGEIAAT
jgi:hypothetical protein